MNSPTTSAEPAATVAPPFENPLHIIPARKAPAWFQTGVTYQIHPRAFTPEGTLQAATAKLGHVRACGAATVYLCPVFAMDDDMDLRFWSPRQIASSRGNPKNPYRIKDYWHVDEEFGTDGDLKAFIDEAHRLGLRVLLDLVYFHCGPGAPLLRQFPQFTQHNADGSIANGPWRFPKLDFGCPALREYLLNNMLYWITQFGVDGFRCDVSDGVPLDFWEEARDRMERLRPGDLAMVAESSLPCNQLKAFDACYRAVWCGDALFTQGGSAEAVVASWWAFEKDRPRGARAFRHFENHDIASDDGENRRERRWGREACDQLLVAIMTLDGVPMLYNGQEFADAGKTTLFAKAPMDWTQLDTPNGQSRLALCRTLSALRATTPAFTSAALAWIETDAPQDVTAFIRTAPDGVSRLVVQNWRDRPVRTTLKLPVGTVGASLLAHRAELTAPTAFALGPFGWDIREGTTPKP